MSRVKKSALVISLVLLATLVATALDSRGVFAANPNADPPMFKQDPVTDLRPVSVDITKDSDGQFEIVLGNPTLNDPDMAGEIKLVVPPGITIYGSILGGSGGTGMVLIPFDRDPIKPGSTRTSTLFVRSQVTGKVKVTADVTVWPVGNKDGYKQAKLHYEAEVKEKSGQGGDPSTKNSEDKGSGGCSIGGKADAGMLMTALLIPGVLVVKRRRKMD